MESFGRLDILVNNAGLGLYASFLEQSDAMIEKVLSTSLKSVIYCSQEAAKVMTEGSIINIASIAGIEPLYGLSIYSAAKAGVIGITKALAIELAPRIRVNAIAPGIVKTKMGESLLKVLKLTEEEYLEKYTLLKKFIEPNEIADAVIFLIKTPSITGQTIVIDAGLSLITFRFSM
jgi:3-oxoacyl-[acyl-carrier protein] reductase